MSGKCPVSGGKCPVSGGHVPQMSCIQGIKVLEDDLGIVLLEEPTGLGAADQHQFI